MKNIQVIDGAMNCTYDVFAADDGDFDRIFPAQGQDIEFVEDFFARLGKDAAAEIYRRLWPRRLKKPDVNGIHGTLFVGLEEKKVFYPTKRDSEMVVAL